MQIQQFCSKSRSDSRKKKKSKIRDEINGTKKPEGRKVRIMNLFNFIRNLRPMESSRNKNGKFVCLFFGKKTNSEKDDDNNSHERPPQGGGGRARTPGLEHK